MISRRTLLQSLGGAAATSVGEQQAGRMHHPISNVATLCPALLLLQWSGIFWIACSPPRLRPSPSAL